MTVVLRADAGPTVGSGHVMRCAALGLRMQRQGHQVSLVTSLVPSAIESWLASSGITVIPLPPVPEAEDAEVLSMVTRNLTSDDWVVVDHYGRDSSWEQSVDRGAARLCVIDDLADRPHQCDVLIDVGMHTLKEDPYRDLVSPQTELLLGPGYALLRPEFEYAPLRKRSGQVSKILISLGGGDKVLAELPKVLAAVASLPAPRPQVRVLRDESLAPVVDPLAQAIPGVTCLDFVKDMPGMLTWADLVVGTCGGSSWERCLMGVPTIVCLTAENQRGDLEGLSRAGAVVSVGDVDTTGPGVWLAALSALLNAPDQVRYMGLAAAAVMKDRERCLERMDGLLATRAP